MLMNYNYVFVVLLILCLKHVYSETHEMWFKSYRSYVPEKHNITRKTYSQAVGTSSSAGVFTSFQHLNNTSEHDSIRKELVQHLYQNYNSYPRRRQQPVQQQNARRTRRIAKDKIKNNKNVLENEKVYNINGMYPRRRQDGMFLNTSAYNRNRNYTENIQSVNRYNNNYLNNTANKWQNINYNNQPYIHYNRSYNRWFRTKRFIDNKNSNEEYENSLDKSQEDLQNIENSTEIKNKGIWSKYFSNNVMNAKDKITNQFLHLSKNIPQIIDNLPKSNTLNFTELKKNLQATEEDAINNIQKFTKENQTLSIDPLLKSINIEHLLEKRKPDKNNEENSNTTSTERIKPLHEGIKINRIIHRDSYAILKPVLQPTTLSVANGPHEETVLIQVPPRRIVCPPNSRMARGRCRSIW